MVTHSYLDPLVYKANRVEHLKFQEFPPLSDRHYARNLVNRSYAVSTLLFSNIGHF